VMRVGWPLCAGLRTGTEVTPAEPAVDAAGTPPIWRLGNAGDGPERHLQRASCCSSWSRQLPQCEDDDRDSTAHRPAGACCVSDVRSNLPGWFVRLAEKAGAPRVRTAIRASRDAARDHQGGDA
jgi:hypothetical protein